MDNDGFNQGSVPICNKSARSKSPIGMQANAVAKPNNNLSIQPQELNSKNYNNSN